MSQSLQYALTENSIAVLPFMNRSTDPEIEYFSDGVTDEIINALAKIRSLKVIARNSAFAFKSNKLDIQEIGKKLGVAAVLKGSIRLAKEKIRISVQMINVADGVHVWSESFDRTLEDVFAVQDEISCKVANKMREFLGHFDIDDQLIHVPEITIATYKLYLKARFLNRQLNQPDTQSAIFYLDQIIEAEPNFAWAYLEMHTAYTFLGALGVMSTKEAFKQANQYLEKAIKIDANLPECQYQMAQIHLWQKWDLGKSCRLLMSAIKAKPSYADAHQLMGVALFIQGNYKAAQHYLDIAMRLNPFDANVHFQLGAMFYYQERYETALAYFEKSMSLDPEFLFAHIMGAAVSLLQQRIDLALEKVRDLPSSAEVDLSKVFIQTIAFSRQLNKEKVAEGIRVLESALKTEAKERALIFLIYVYTAEGHFEHALELFEEAIVLRSSMLLFLVNDPLLNRIQQQEKFQVLKKEILRDQHTYELPKSSYKKALLKEEEVEQYGKQLTALMEEEKLFLNPTVSLRDLASRLGIHPNALSQLLNQQFNKNFAEYINSYRLDSFKKKALEPASRNLTILAMAFESGFNSKTTFNTFFKKWMGKTPSQFWKEEVLGSDSQ